MLVFPVLAAVPEEGLTPKKTEATISPGEKSKIEEIKDKVSAKINEMREKTPRVVVGTVKSLGSVETFVLESKTGSEYTVAVNEDAKINWVGFTGKKTELKLRDIAVSDKLVVVGPYDGALKQISAAKIIGKSFTENFNGILSEVGKNSAVLKDKNGQLKTVSLDATTKIRVYIFGKGLINGTLKNLEAGDRVHINAYKKSKDAEDLVARRILDLPVNPAISPTPKLSPTPSLKPSPAKTSAPGS